MLTILSFIVVLGVLIFVHEFGHFIVARKSGVRVLNFSIGFGPKLIKRTVGETEYALSAFPLGGYVRLLGDDPKEVIDPSEVHRSFLHQSLTKKIAIVFAGPFFNLLLAVVIFAGLYFVNGVEVPSAKLGKIQADSPAERAGLRAGDRVLEIDGEAVSEWDDIRKRVQASRGREMAFLVERAGEPASLKVTAERSEVSNIFGEPEMMWMVGVEQSGETIYRYEKYNPLASAYMGVERTVYLTKLTVLGIIKMIQGKLSFRNIGGPIMIGQMSGQVASQGGTVFLSFMALLSINLGIINLLPIPILDGGHLLFFVIEGVMGKPVSLRKREIAQQVGLFILIFIMLLAIYNDVTRIFSGSQDFSGPQE